jgi:ABC-type antimicrobial peptide transport system permease subunit
MLALGYFTFKDLMHDRWRSLLTIISLAVVVAGYLLLASLSRAFLTVGKQSQVTNNLVIISADAIDPMESSLDEEILQTAREIAPDQIQRAFPTLFRHMNIEGRILQVRAVPLEEMPTALNLTLLADGAWPSGSRQIVVGEEIARVASWRIGSTVNIYGSDFQVTGLVRAADNNLGAIWMTYPEGQRLFGMQHGFQVGYLPLVPSADPESVRTLLQADPSISAHYTVYLENVVSNGYNQVIHNLVTLSSIMAIVSLLAITFGIYNSTSLSLTERSYEIGLLRVIGFTQGKLRGFLFTRALVLTLAAYGLGWVVLDIFYNYRNLHSPMGFSEAPLNLSLTPSASLLGLALATAFAFLGVWLTSGHFATLNPLTGSD